MYTLTLKRVVVTLALVTGSLAAAPRAMAYFDDLFLTN